MYAKHTIYIILTCKIRQICLIHHIHSSRCKKTFSSISNAGLLLSDSYQYMMVLQITNYLKNIDNILDLCIIIIVCKAPFILEKSFKMACTS